MAAAAVLLIAATTVTVAITGDGAAPPVPAPAASATTPAAAEPRFTRGPYLTSLGQTTARLRWRTDPPVPVEVRLRGPSGAERPLRDGALTGLRPDTTYRWTATPQGGAPSRGSLTTAPRRLTGPITLVAFGDHGTGSDEQRAVARLARRIGPRLMLTTGDNSYLVALEGLLDDNVFSPLAPALAVAPLTGVVGDHDTIVASGRRALAAALDLPGGGDRFDLRYGPVQVVGLGVLSDAGDVPFAARALARPGPAVRLVLIHRPLKPGDPLLGVVRRAGVSAVLSGHLHAYERRSPAGVPLLTVGTGGAPVSPTQTPRSPDAAVHLRAFGLLRIDIGPQRVVFRFVDITGRTRDRLVRPLPG